MREGSEGLDLNLRSLRALVTVVEEGHFGRAAAKLYVTGPALSQQIRRLEQHLGLRLIDRDAHPLLLTPAGELFIPHAYRLLEAAQDAALELTQLARKQVGTLRIGFINGGAGRLTTSLLTRLSTPLELTQLEWPEQLSAVTSGRVDASFVRPPMPPADGLTLDRITTEPRVVALHREHRLALRSSVSIDELDDEIHVGTDQMMDEWKAWWAVDPRPSGRAVQYGQIVRTMDEELQVVATGAAIAITAASIASYYSGVEVKFVPVVDIEPCAIDLCTRTGDDHPGVLEIRRLVAEMKEDPMKRGEVAMRAVLEQGVFPL